MKICKYCGTKVQDSQNECPGCHAIEFYRVVEYDDQAVDLPKKGPSFFKALRMAPKNIRLVLYVSVLAVLLLLAVNFRQHIKPDSGIVRETKIVNFGFKDIGELATQEVYYTEVDSVEKYRKLFNFDFSIPGTKATCIFSIDGKIKAGIAFQDIGYEIDDENRIVNVNLPEAKVLSNELDFNSVVIWYENKNILNPKSSRDANEMYTELAQKAEAKAIDNGLLKKAVENAETIIISLCKQQLPDYEVVFKR